MTIAIVRPPIEDSSRTISDIYIDGVWFSNVLEDRDRGLHQTDALDYIEKVKVKHETAIPYGTYQVVMSYSNRFQKYLPELLNVPGFAGIRLHAGNTEADSSGCLLPGIKAKDRVIQSRVTFTKLMSLIQKKIKQEKVYISIVPSKVVTLNSANNPL
jgi:hypothetical protein